MTKKTSKKAVGSIEMSNGTSSKESAYLNNNPYANQPLLNNSTYSNVSLYRFYHLEDEDDEEIQATTKTQNNKREKGPPGGKEKKQEANNQRASRASVKQTHDAIWEYRANEANTHDKRFTRNKIRTTKYTWYSFLPKNLFE